MADQVPLNQAPDDNRQVVRRSEPLSLTPAQLAERAIIPYVDGANRQLVDSFRELRTRLLATSNDNFITLIAPVTEGCGGGFVARNLALAMTFDQARSSLLIDCNLRQPSQHAAMKIDTPRGGLLDYLENPDATVESMMYSTGIPRLSLIPAGRSGLGGMEIEHFSSFRMRLLLDSLRSSHADRYIFLDGPPTLGAPDARMLSELADVVVLVAGYGRNTVADITAAAGNFDPQKFAGVVFNENG
ncbi:CpsD/CapB family tyrosine-protein kinase [Agrilutibacter solisilvae]|uniref:Polysaccharide biosynthesis protein n=1 Tax=Agrilutibacter solisilvae TaxID=2763317 RepID=A0A974XZ89_9GAMM|nr:CpsD/CapB family tyrosine-protein kinase [Lysobacter solisilvae]QSX77675.1 polysaccharide biosynthesis protein [Lysobacter solisilvae]